MGTVTRPKEMVAVESERAATDAIIACVRQPPTPGRGSVFKSAEIMARLDCSVMDDRPSASDGQRAVERLPLVEIPTSTMYSATGTSSQCPEMVGGGAGSGKGRRS